MVSGHSVWLLLLSTLRLSFAIIGSVFVHIETMKLFHVQEYSNCLVFAHVSGKAIASSKGTWSSKEIYGSSERNKIKSNGILYNNIGYIDAFT